MRSHPALPLSLLALALAACGLMPPDPKSSSKAPPPVDAPRPQAPPPGDTPVDQLPPPFPGYQLVWHDEFDGTALDTLHWKADDAARHDAINTPDAVTVADGVLTITSYTDATTQKTGFLSTDGLFLATYGYFEARIKFQDAPGEWCSFWLQSPTIGQPIGDPAHAGVEIDVVEHRVTDQDGWALADWVALNLNWDGYGPEKQNEQDVTQLPGLAPVEGQWHTYAVLWTPAGYTFYVDGVPLWSRPGPVSQRSEWIQLTCEIQNASWAGFIPAKGYGTRAESTTGMQVDWVRVWQST